MKSGLSDNILLWSKGLCMGAADAIPGVSGGTIAFITGIYDELIFSLNAIDGQALLLLRKLELKAFWEKINGTFMAILLAGVAIGIVLNLVLISYLLKNYPVHIWSFFFGLILISAPLILRDIKAWSWKPVAMFLFGIAIAYLITVSTPTRTPETYWFIFIAGAIAICAMILPGISGAFILLLLGKYQFMAAALRDFNVPVVIVFLIGCTVGILAFSRFLSWILANYHSATVALLAGFMLGSLNKVWPWREVLEYTTNSKGEQIPVFDKSILPWHYFATTGKDPQVLQAILMMALGVFIVVLIEKIAVRLKTQI